MGPVIGITTWKEQACTDVIERLNVWNLKAMGDAGKIPVALIILYEGEFGEEGTGFAQCLDQIYETFKA